MLRRALNYLDNLFQKIRRNLFVQHDIGENLLLRLNHQIQEGLALEHARSLSAEAKVHEFRKAVKRSRSLLRVLKSRTANNSYYKIDELLGNSARSMTYPRESTVNLQTFMDLCLTGDNHLSPELINQIRTELAKEVLNAYSNQDNRFDKLMESSFKMLFNAQFHLNGLRINSFKYSELNTFLDKTYFKGKKLFEASYYSSDTEVIHKWRKYAKHLLFQLKLSPHGYNCTDSEYLIKLDKITSSLGNDHDLAVLEEYIEKNISVNPEEFKQLKLSILKVRSLMQRKAFKLGHQLFSKDSLEEYLYPATNKTLA